MLRHLGVWTLAGIAAGFVLHGVARADVYQWIDEHGEPHYSDRWVPGSKLIRSSRPHPLSEGAEGSARPAADGSNAASPAGQAANNPPAPDAAALKTVREDRAKVRDEQCKKAREAYERAMTARRIMKPGKSDAEREYLSEDEADSYRAQTRSQVQSLCGSVPALSGG